MVYKGYFDIMHGHFVFLYYEMFVIKQVSPKGIIQLKNPYLQKIGAPTVPAVILKNLLIKFNIFHHKNNYCVNLAGMYKASESGEKAWKGGQNPDRR